ncbi:MAG: hypothetical protein ABI572_05860 [Actinomycetota bacterium]
MVGLLGVLAVAPAACADASQGVGDPGQASPSSGAVRDSFAEEIGLIAHQWSDSSKLQQTPEGLTMDGQLLDGCETPAKGDSFAFKILPNGHLYCYSGPTKLDVWVIGQRLSGHVPTEEEIAAASDDFER